MWYGLGSGILLLAIALFTLYFPLPIANISATALVISCTIGAIGILMVFVTIFNAPRDTNGKPEPKPQFPLPPAEKK